MNTLYMMRGYPGSGKSTWANKKSNDTGAIVCSSDSYFMKDGKYEFDYTKLASNHRKCYIKFLESMCLRKDIIIDNTNAKISDIKTYLNMVNSLQKETSDNYRVRIVTVKYNSIDEAIAHRKDQPDNKNVSGDIIKNIANIIEAFPSSELINIFPDIVFEFETIEHK